MLSQEHMDKNTQEQTKTEKCKKILTTCIATCLFLSLNLVAVRKFCSAYFSCAYNA